MQKNYILQFDGMLRTIYESPTPVDVLGYGWLLTREGREIAHGFGLFCCRGAVNSVLAEYLALSEGLEAIAYLHLNKDRVEIRGDARSVIDQMRGAASVSAPATLVMHQRARALSCRFRHLTWTWIPRNENKSADRLSRRGLRQIRAHLEESLRPARIPDKGPDGLKLVPIMDLTLVHSHSFSSRSRMVST
jgi:ribonuclease HI